MNEPRVKAKVAFYGKASNFQWETAPYSKADSYQVCDVHGIGRLSVKRATRGSRFFNAHLNGEVIVTTAQSCTSIEEAKFHIEKHVNALIQKDEKAPDMKATQRRHMVKKRTDAYADSVPAPPPTPVVDVDLERIQQHSLTAVGLDDKTLQRLMDSHTDVTGAHLVQIQIRKDEKVIWINVNGVNLLRICEIDKLQVSHGNR